ncbi:MAG: hypothetical protein DWB42_17355 [Chloroflexi bacterium]|nr:hypothetical protein [Chloroflexota bacterium]MDL1885518.1 hypothetical protein [Anaerolineae bacterium CFX8]
MGAVSLGQFLTLFGWFSITVVLVFLLLIARFYQRFAGEKTFYEFFLIPIVLFGVAAVRYSSIDQMAGDAIADLLLAAGGLALIVLCVFLYWMMTRNR